MRPNATRRLSARGLVFLTEHEGFRARLYNDSRGFATIGFGHLVHRGRVGTNKLAELEFIKGLTVPAALKLLLVDVGIAEDGVIRSIDAVLTQNEFDALVSFTFNVGTGALQRSTLRKRLNQGEYESVPSEMARWIKGGPGLKSRREKEGALWMQEV